jgi:hypothetical protein
VVGWAGNSNTVVISNGGTMTNGQLSFGGIIGLYAGASNNSVVVTGTGSSWNNAGDLLVGWDDSGNKLTITNGGTVKSSQINYGGAIGFNVGSSNNSVVVTGSGSSWSNSGDLLLGVSGSGNSMVISNGGTVSNSQVNYGGVIGWGGSSSNNSVLVNGNGSSWNNSTNLTIGYDGSGNTMVVAGGASVVSGIVNVESVLLSNGGSGVIGLNADSSNNSVLITGSGSSWSNGGSLTIGNAGTGNSLTVANGGSVVAGAVIVASSGGSSGTLNIGSLGGSDAGGTILTPTITFGSGSGTINFNQVDTATMTNIISGNGSLNQLGSGTTILTRSNSYSGSTTVSAGTLLADSSNALGTSMVIVTNSGTLGGNGTIQGATTIASGGTLAAGSGGVGSLSFNGGLSLESGSTTSFQIHSTNDFTSINLIGSSVTYGGSLVFNLINFTPVSGNEFTLFNMSGGATESGEFSSVEVGSSYLTDVNGLWSGSNDGVTYQFNDATGQLSVQAVPEPSTWALLGLGALGMLMFNRGRKVA